MTNENVALDVLLLPEFNKPQGAGSEVVKVKPVNRIIPSEMPHFVATGTGDNGAMLVDTRSAMMYCIMRGVNVEHDRIASRQLSGIYVSCITGFLTVDRRSRLIINKSLEFASNGFPQWMSPLN